MRKFLIRVLSFLLPLSLVIILGICLPVTPRASKSMLMSSLNKNQLLKNTSKPRIIFVGGSNLSFGINSNIIKDSLRLNPVNTAIHGSIGIKFMIDNTLNYIQSGDIVVLVPEYSHYYRSLDKGKKELMRMVFDVDIENIKYFNLNQVVNILEFLPEYSLTKLKISEYRNITESDVYSINSFNRYGDAIGHWGKQQEVFKPLNFISDEFNYKTINYFEKFDSEVKKRGAFLLVSYPCLQEKSYNNSVNSIHKVENELKKSKLNIIGTAERYVFSDSLMFNTPYHLNMVATNKRTTLLIEDIKRALRYIN
jgi:hypothetical protein